MSGAERVGAAVVSVMMVMCEGAMLSEPGPGENEKVRGVCR